MAAGGRHIQTVRTRGALAALLVAVLLSACGRSGDPGDRDVSTGDSPTTTAESEPSPSADNGEWIAMADPPASLAPGGPAVWTGSHVIVWGGGAFVQGSSPIGGGAYDPAANTWEELPEAPVPAPDGHTAVWTGREVLYWGGAESSRNVERRVQGTAVAYDPAAKTWRRIAPAPIPMRTFHEAVWTGTEMVIWGGVTECCPIDSVIHDKTAAAYDPTTDTWRELANVPPPWSGDDGPAVTVSHGGDVFVWRNGELGRYSVAEDSWRSLGGEPADPNAPGGNIITTGGPVAIGTLVGDALFLWIGGGRATDGRVFALPGAKEKTVADAGQLTGFAPLLTGASDAIFATDFDYDDTEPGEGSGLWRYDIASDKWEALPEPRAEIGAGAFPVWTGRELVVLPGFVPKDEGSERATGAVFRRR